VSSNLGRGRITVWSPLAGWAGTFFLSGRRTIRNLRHHGPEYVPLKSAHFLGASGPHLLHGSLDLRESASPNSISIGSAVFAQLTRVYNAVTHRRAIYVTIGRIYALRGDAASKVNDTDYLKLSRQTGNQLMAADNVISSLDTKVVASSKITRARNGQLTNVPQLSNERHYEL